MSDTPLQHIEVSREAYLHNLATFRRLLRPGCRLMAVVKSNAYGHGLEPVSRLAAEGGADELGVNCLEEGIAIRQLGIGLPVVILGYTPLAGLGAAIDHRLEPVLYNLPSLERLHAEAARRSVLAPFHLKLETGVHRQGVMPEDLPAVIECLRRADRLVLQGASMHFANIEDTTDHSFARLQQDRFQLQLQQLREAGFPPRQVHAGCSAATILFPETHFDMVRVGISSYGLWPSKETYLAAVLLNHTPPVLRPVMTWKTRIAQIKSVPADHYIGYGCSHRTTHPVTLAVLPVGYFDGYDRGLSNQGHVLVRGQRAPVLGRVCMNMIMADVTHIPGASVEDEAVLLGGQGSERVSAEEMASLCHTINYEIVSRLGAHIPRIVT